MSIAGATAEPSPPTRVYRLSDLGSRASQAEEALRALRVAAGSTHEEDDLHQLQAEVQRLSRFCDQWDFANNAHMAELFSKDEYVLPVPTEYTTVLFALLDRIFAMIDRVGRPEGAVPPDVQIEARSISVDMRSEFSRLIVELAALATSDRTTSRFKPEAIQYLEATQRGLMFDSAKEVAEEARDRAVKAAEDSTLAAGISGTSGLAKSFGDRADAESFRAEAFRIATIISALCIIAFTVWWIARTDALSATWMAIALKLAVVVPGGALTAYLARQASNHRSRSDEARDVEVRLKTLEAYISPLDEPQRNEIRMRLGSTIFADNPSEGSGNSAASSETNEIGNLISKIGDLIGQVAALIRPGAK